MPQAQLTLDGDVPDWRDAKEVHVSVSFSYDIPKAEQLAESWHKAGFPVTMGGPAFNIPGGNFTPGMYLKKGYVITSRGCNNTCWFCKVPEREHGLRELPIQEGWNILDDNFLACSENHIRAVFEMLKTQPQTHGTRASSHMQCYFAMKTAKQTRIGGSFSGCGYARRLFTES